MSALQAPHATPVRFFDVDSQKTAVIFLGEMSASTYAGLPPRMQAACREMVRLREMTIEGMPCQMAGAQSNENAHTAKG